MFPSNQLGLSKQALYQLSTEEDEAIEAGRREIKNGNFVANETVISEMKEWLQKK